MTYSQKLKDPRWQKRRLEVLSFYGFQCFFCKDLKSELHVHHKQYLRGRSPWDYSDDELVVLCVVCHEKIEGLLKRVSRMAGDDLSGMEALSVVCRCLEKGLCEEISMIATALDNAHQAGEFANYARTVNERPLTEAAA